MSVFLIAEAGVNHNGSEDLAAQLVAGAAECKVDAVKFQTFRAEQLVALGAPKAEYQKKWTGDGDQFEMLKKLELSEAVQKRLFEQCCAVGIEFMSTPFDAASADFLVALGMRRIKIPSGEITNLPFLAHLAEKNLPLILSTGMSDLEDVAAAVACIRAVRTRCGFEAPLNQVLSILHCTSSYPAEPEDVHLRAMQTMAKEFEVRVGYSDHTEGTDIAIAAVAMGASIVEKHFTLDRSLPGPDQKASLELGELASMVRSIRRVEQALGSDAKKPTSGELRVRRLVRRSVATRRQKSAGEFFESNDLVLLRPGDGIPPAELANVVGRAAKTDIAAGTTLKWSDIE
jgi:N,N'-diacetyllegionaminate synthase